MIANTLRRWFDRGARLKVFYDEAYRLPLSGVESGPAHLETRRADDAVHYLLAVGAISAADVLTPLPASYGDLGRVHSDEYLESLQRVETLAHIFAVDPTDVFVDEVMRTIRLATGGTIQGARHALEHRSPVLNTLGGFHHATPTRGAGFCAVHDIAVAIAVLRADGFTGRVAVLDLDCHPPDGTSACLGRDPTVWLGSISGTAWGALEGVDEVHLPERTGDDEYLAGLERLLSRMPKVDFAFVLAGGDVLAGDRLGTLGLSLAGVRRRDLRVFEHFAELPQVWVPAGGYTSYAWQVLAGSGLVLARSSTEPIPQDYDPLAARMRGIARTLKAENLGSPPMLSEADVAEALGLPRSGPRRLLDFYTAEGLEFALEKYRVLPLLRRLGFEQLHVVLDRAGGFDRARLLGKDATTGASVVLVELEVDRRRVGTGTFLFVNWLSLRNPRAKFSSVRPQLPGQEVPGLGLAKEVANLLGLIATRLVLDGVAFRPSWFHMAWAARDSARFVDPRRQGRFEALCRDLRQVPLLQATRAVAEGRVLLNGAPYAWEADEMVRWLHPKEDEADRAAITTEREASHFTLVSSGSR
ncbi:MAG: histone deacetylase [Myxococcaceae bacterium]|nr:histone deacetylase [Myxococcaceae bacterium]